MSMGKTSGRGGGMGMSKHRKSGKTTKPAHLKIRANLENQRKLDEEARQREARRPKMVDNFKELFK